MSEARNPNRSGDLVIPDKLYFRIGEVARLLDVETHTLRFWETEFPQLKVGKGGTGQRLYRRRDVELVLEIKHLLYNEGYTIPGARQFLQNRTRGKDAAKLSPAQAEPRKPEQVQQRASQRQDSQPGLHQIRDELRDLSAMLTETDQNHSSSDSGSPRNPLPSTRPSPPRRGLHLATRPPANQPPAQRLPSLFDPDSE